MGNVKLDWAERPLIRFVQPVGSQHAGQMINVSRPPFVAVVIYRFGDALPCAWLN